MPTSWAAGGMRWPLARCAQPEPLRHWHRAPPARSCRARRLLNRAVRCGHRAQHHRLPCSTFCNVCQWQRLCPCQFAQGWRWVRTRYGHTLRFYITPHFAKCAPAAALKLRLWLPPLRALTGLQNGRYAKWPSLGFGTPAPGHHSGATRCALASGLRPAPTCEPPPTLLPCCFAASATRRTAHPPPEGAPSACA